MDLTKITNLSYDEMLQLLWTTWDIARKCTVSDTMMLVLAFLAVPSLTLVCVCACSCVGVSVESLKFEGGARVYGEHGSATVLSSQEVLRVLLCNEALGTSFR